MIAGLAALAMIHVAPPELDVVARESVAAAVAKLPGSTAEAIGVSIAIPNSDTGSISIGGWRQGEPMYPASVVKLFFLVTLMDQLREGRISMTPELERATSDMVRNSSNDATGLVLDALTDTGGGTELPPEELARWMDKRRAVNRWYRARGYLGINVNQKTWNEGPYGRERQGYGPNFEFRNSLHPEACARLMAELSLGKLLDARHTEMAFGYLKRDNPAENPQADFQARAFIGKALKPGFKLWSKAGYVTNERHDVALIESPAGERLALAIFTKKPSQMPDMVPTIAAEVLRRLGFKSAEAISGTERTRPVEE